MPKPTILIVDDESSLQAALRLILEHDYHLTFASDGEEALKLFQQQPVDLVLLDLKLPKIDGLDVLKSLMTHQPVPRVVVITAYQSTDLSQRALQMGALDYVTKPFDREALKKSVDRALHLPSWQRPTTG